MADLSNTAPTTSDNANSVEVVSGKIMVASVIVLFLVIVFILFLHLYARWFWSQNYTAGDQEQGTGPTRRYRRRRFVFAPTQDALGSVYQEGLEPEVIRSLPVVIFNGDDFKDGLECAVCLCEVEDGEKARLLPKCNHGFHVDCIDMWFQSHSTCPICRNTVSGSATTPGQEDVESTDDSSSFPTNVLFWGNGQNPVSSRTISQEGPSSSSSSPNGMLVIEIPNDAFPSLPSSNEMKSPTTSSTPRFRSLTRLMSRGKRVIPSGPPSPAPAPAPAPAPSLTNFDVEQGQVGRGQISKTNSDS